MKKEFVDQIAHIFVFLAIVGIPAISSSILSCAISGFLFGLFVEIKERGSVITVGNIKRALRSWKDLLGYTIGGIILGLLL